MFQNIYIMKNLKIISLIALVLSTATISDNQLIDAKKISVQNNLFAFDLYQQIAKNNSGNLFFSPFSISTAMAMTYAGATGQTAEEMSKAMHYYSLDDEFHLSYSSYLKRLESNAKDNIQLRIANRLWAEKKYKLMPSFVEINAKAYNSPLQNMDFMHKSEASRLEINDWVADKTENRIKDLIPSGAITSDTRLVLTNAIYFKGDWLYQFKEKDTKEDKFNLADGSTIKAQFMNFKGALNYYQNATYKMLRLPYKGVKQSMVIVMPIDQRDMEGVEKVINTTAFDYVFFGGTPEVILSLPKFKMTLPLNLNRYLSKLGIKSAFTSGADFSKMTPSNDLYISDVIHKAFIEIDEKGTEAAAATAVIMQVESVSDYHKPKPVEFIADHPFLFYIIDDETKAILFMGRLMNPS